MLVMFTRLPLRASPSYERLTVGSTTSLAANRVRSAADQICGMKLVIAMSLPCPFVGETAAHGRSEEHTSELQSRENLVCRLLLEKKKKTNEQRTQPRIA